MLQIDSTLKHPLDQVCDLVRFAYRVVECYYARAKAEDRLKTPITVEIQNSSRSAYSGSAGRGRGRVFMRIAGASFYPTLAKYRRYTHIPEFPCYLLESWQEGLVMLAAHELFHMGGASGRMEGEFLCEMIGLEALQAYRASRGLPPAHVGHISFGLGEYAQIRRDWIAKSLTKREPLREVLPDGAAQYLLF